MPCPGENREGTVPARARRADVAASAAMILSAAAGLKSGKPSVGDSGMFSRSGVELPLVGGPQRLGLTPSCACISRALSSRVSQRSPSEIREEYLLLEKILLPERSCDGEPVPILDPLPIVEFRPGRAFVAEKEERTPFGAGCSTGELFAVECPDRVGAPGSGGM